MRDFDMVYCLKIIKTDAKNSNVAIKTMICPVGVPPTP